MWSAADVGPDGVAAWTPRGVIHLDNILPIGNPEQGIRLLGSVEGSDVVFVSTDLGIYKLHLKSLRHKKILDAQFLLSLSPYTSFCNLRGNYSYFFL
jgi:hypothetical protein